MQLFLFPENTFSCTLTFLLGRSFGLQLWDNSGTFDRRKTEFRRICDAHGSKPNLALGVADLAWCCQWEVLEFAKSNSSSGVVEVSRSSVYLHIICGESWPKLRRVKHQEMDVYWTETLPRVLQGSRGPAPKLVTAKKTSRRATMEAIWDALCGVDSHSELTALCAEVGFWGQGS